MRLSTLLCGVAATAAFPLALALVTIKNNGVFTDLVIPDTYIVRYKTDINSTGKEDHEYTIDSMAKKASKRGIFDKFNIPGLQGYAAEISPDELDVLMASDLVDYIEKDTIVRAADMPPYPNMTKLSPRTMITQQNVPWNLARISHRRGNHSDYYYSDTAGNGIRIYVIDTGIRLSHADFAGGRAVWGANFIASSPNADEDGHGTHVAGIIAGATHGVAKKATVVAVKVLDKSGTGSMSGLLQGLNWAVADAERRGVANRTVVNMSLTGAYTQSVDDGVKAATEAGITVVVAAGNVNESVSDWSPASAPEAITVGAMDRHDRRAGFSNWGTGVDIFAPGVEVLSAYNGSDQAEALMTGTSMAAPHVAGLAAYFMAKEGLYGSATVKGRILNSTSRGAVDRKGGADRIAYNGSGR